MGQVKKYEDININDISLNELIKNRQVKKIINWHVTRYKYAFDTREDARQEAYICLIKAVRSFKASKKCPFLAYFFRILRNKFITENKKNSKVLEQTEDKNHFEKFILSPYASYSYNIVNEFDNLNNTEKNVLFDRFFKLKTLKEISMEIGVSKEWARRLIQKSLFKIKTQLQTV